MPHVTSANAFLVIAAALNGVIALLHFACIAIGAPAFRALGAGDQIGRMAERGLWYPNLAAFMVGAAFSVCATYALSAAGLLGHLPLRGLLLGALTAVLFVRAVAFPLLKPFFPGNSDTFWIVTSGCALTLAIIHLIGLKQVWSTL